jgi:hypothetical protein
MNENKENTESPNKNKDIIDRVTAEKEFIRYCESNEIEYDEAALNDEEKESFKDIKQRFLKACIAGRVEVDGILLKYTISHFSPEGFKGEVLTIKRAAGHAFSEMDNFKERENVHKLLAYISAMTGKEIKYFSKLDSLDWKFLSSIASLFLSL